VRRTEAAVLAAALVLRPIVAGAEGREPAVDAPLSAAEARGKALYLTGESPSGSRVAAYFGEGELELPGSAATCGSCHGPDGKGRPESGVVPTNVSWKHLTKAYGHLHESGLEHPPFDAASFARYVTSGLYPGGRRGDPAMPRYALSAGDLEDLVAYLKRLGAELDPGLAATTIRVGTLVPSGGPLAPIGEAIRRVLAACFEAVNAQGGIYGRSVSFDALELPLEEEPALAKLDAWLATTEPFALVASFTPGLERQVQRRLAERGAPLVGPFALRPLASFSLNRHVFYLLPGLAEQVRALLRFAGQEAGPAPPRLAVVHPEGAPLDDVLEAVRDACRKQGWPEPRPLAYVAGAGDEVGVVSLLRQGQVDLVVHLGNEAEIRDFLGASARAGWTPRVLAPGALAGRLVRDAPAGFRHRLYLAYPTLPRDRRPEALQELAHLMAESGVGAAHLQAAATALAAARLTLEVLRRAGRDLTRDGMRAALERLYSFDTGLTPPLTYTRNRRIGADGSWVLVVDPAAAAAGGTPGRVEWVKLQ